MSKKINLIDLAKAGKWSTVKMFVSKMSALDIRLSEEIANPSVDLMEYAITQNNVAVVKQLLEKKDYVDITGLLSMTAKTIRFHYNNIAKILVDRIASAQSINAVFDKGPLIHVSVWSRNIEMLKYLLDYGADPNLKGKSRLRPLHIACKYNEYQAFNILLSQPSIRVNVHSSPRGFTPLFEAVAVGNRKMIVDLINAGANPNGLLYNGVNLLGTDYIVKDHELRRLLLSLGINVNQIGPFGDNMVNVVLLKYQDKISEMKKEDLQSYLLDLLPIMDPIVLNSQNFKGFTTLDFILMTQNWRSPELRTILEKITWDIFQKDIKGKSIYYKAKEHFNQDNYKDFVDIIAKSYLHSIHDKDDNPKEKSKWEIECTNLMGQSREQLLSQLKKSKIKVPRDTSKENVCMLLAKYQIENKNKSYSGSRLFELFKKIDIIIKPKNRFNPIIWRGSFAWEWLLNKYVCDKHHKMINNHFPTLREFLKPVKTPQMMDAIFAFVWTKVNNREKLIPPLYLKPASLHKRGLKQFSHFPFIITYSENKAHENSIIIDHKNKTVERFEPHGYKGAHYYNTRQLTIELKKYFRKILPGYTFLDSKDIYPRRGVQTYEHILSYQDISYEFKPGYCAAWSAWYMDLIITNWNIIEQFRTRQEFINAALVKIHQQFSSAQKYIMMYLDHTQVYQKLNTIVEKVPFFTRETSYNPIDFADTAYIFIDPHEGNSPENKAAVQFRKLLYSAK